MKKIVCRPAPELEIELSGGESILLRFDLLALMELQDLGSLGEILQRPLPELAACIVYAAAKNNNENFGLEEARSLVSNMSVENIIEIINEFSSAMGAENNKASEELSKNLMAQFLKRNFK